MNENEKRKKIIELCLLMNSSGLNQGTSGNISAVHEGHMLITPSGIPYETLKPKQIAKMPLDASTEDWDGPCNPSSEWHFHRAILQSNPEFGAVIHTHSSYSTILSISQTEIPPCHYMIAAFGGSTVRCADYATFGTPELSANIVQAMQDRSACLMANHGMVVAGKDLDKAMWAAVELETLARQYYHAKLLGGMNILSEDEIAVVVEKFKGYGLQSKNNTAKKKGKAASKKAGTKKKALSKKALSKKAAQKKVGSKKKR